MVLHLFSQGAILTDPINGSDHLGVRYSSMHQVLQVKGKPFIWTPRQSHRHTGEGECVACPVSVSLMPIRLQAHETAPRSLTGHATH